MHGPNLFPNDPPDLRPAVLEWMDAVTRVGRAVLSGIARHLGLEPDWFDGWCADPTVLFRIFRYPVPDPGFTGEWGVAEHTDYGLLTLLAISDRVGPGAPDHGTVGQVPPETGTEGSGLEVRVGGEWIEVPAVADSFVCNLGDMLERMTNGRLRSTPHRVALPTRERLSFPLFLDPGWDVEIRPLPGFEARSSDDTRWDGTDLLADGVAQHLRRLPDRQGRPGVPRPVRLGGRRIPNARTVLLKPNRLNRERQSDRTSRWSDRRSAVATAGSMDITSESTTTARPPTHTSVTSPRPAA